MSTYVTYLTDFYFVLAGMALDQPTQDYATTTIRFTTSDQRYTINQL